MHAIRRAELQDTRPVARLFRAVRLACLPYLPNLHTAEQDLCFFRDRVFAAQCALQPLLRVIGDFHIESGRTQVRREQLAQRTIVIDQEHSNRLVGICGTHGQDSV